MIEMNTDSAIAYLLGLDAGILEAPAEFHIQTAVLHSFIKPVDLERIRFET